MIIKNVRLETDGEYSVLSAECKIRKIGWDKLYFKLLTNQHSSLVNDASPFAAALLIPAMRLNEELVIHGSISEQLYKGMHAIMDEVITWKIDVNKIKISVDKLKKDTFEPRETGSFFTGGVDSFYTFLEHQEKHGSEREIKNLLFIKGFDVKLNDTKLWESTYDNIQQVADDAHVNVIAMETNIREKIEPILVWNFKWFSPWDYIHGSCLAAAGLAFRNNLKTIYIPSTFSVEEQLPWGSHLSLDKNWGTEVLQFIHDGSDATRAEKISNVVSKSPLALNHLKVCYVNTDGKLNCGICDKCLRTMITFYAIGALDKVKTFPHTFDLSRVAQGLHHIGDGNIILYGERLNLKLLEERNLNPELQTALKQGIEKTESHKRSAFEKLKIDVIKLEAKLRYIDYAYFGGLFI